MITIYTIAFNEELMLPHFIKHYRAMFPDCKIVIYDNESADQTVTIAKAYGCEVRTYSTGGKLDDQAYLDIKNHCWKDADTNWVLVCDVDEHCRITAKELKQEEDLGTTIIKFNGYNMVNLQDNLKIEEIEMGVRATSYDKFYLFDKRWIREINYMAGCHRANVKGNAVLSLGDYTCKHYKYVNPDYMIARHATFSARMSANNRKKGWAVHYDYPADRIRTEFENARLNAQIVL